MLVMPMDVSFSNFPVYRLTVTLLSLFTAAVAWTVSNKAVQRRMHQGRHRPGKVTKTIWVLDLNKVSRNVELRFGHGAMDFGYAAI